MIKKFTPIITFGPILALASMYLPLENGITSFIAALAFFAGFLFITIITNTIFYKMDRVLRFKITQMFSYLKVATSLLIFAIMDKIVTSVNFGFKGYLLVLVFLIGLVVLESLYKPLLVKQMKLEAKR